MERGRLQTLPVAYDARNNAWFDSAASGVRHSKLTPMRWWGTEFRGDRVQRREVVGFLSGLAVDDRGLGVEPIRAEYNGWRREMNKMKWVVICVALACAFVTLPGVSKNVQAAPACYVCTVDATGPAGKNMVQVYLTNVGGEFTNQLFKSHGEKNREVLATALTAISIGGKVKVFAEGASGSEILKILLLKEEVYVESGAMEGGATVWIMVTESTV
jgi:hypothetical protein